MKTTFEGKKGSVSTKLRTYTVEVVAYEADTVVKRIPCGSDKRKAEKVDDGLQHNLNHTDFFTRITEADE